MLPEDRRWLILTGATLIALAAATHGVYAQLTYPGPRPDAEPIDIFPLYIDVTPTSVVTTAGWLKIPMTVPRWQFLSDRFLWLHMHFEDWDSLPADLRAEGLERLLEIYGRFATDRTAWPRMSANDWDEVPQPLRAMATVGMIEVWTAHYHAGEKFDLDQTDVLRTIKAIAMSESWFDHRALLRNHDGTMDIGIGGASDFARRTIRRWYDNGWCDFTMTEDDYFDPWLATRWLVFWFNLMLDEANGDLDLAVRAYNWGIGRASAGAGADYLEGVHRRRVRYFEGPSNSPTWRTLSTFRRAHSVPANVIHIVTAAR